MPLTIENAQALVVGGNPPKEKDMQQPAAPQNQKVKVLRAFYYQGKAIEKDAVVELPKLFAKDMKSANKVAFVEPEPAAPAAPAVTEKSDKPAGKEKSK